MRSRLAFFFLGGEESGLQSLPWRRKKNPAFGGGRAVPVLEERTPLHPAPRPLSVGGSGLAGRLSQLSPLSSAPDEIAKEKKVGNPFLRPPPP